MDNVLVMLVKRLDQKRKQVQLQEKNRIKDISVTARPKFLYLS